MDDDHISISGRSRGRPRGRANHEVVMRLLDATETLLKTCSHYDLTEKKIAAAADVHDRLIHYYFENKDGLLFAVSARYRDEIAEKLKHLEKLDAATPSISRVIVKTLLDAYYDKPWVAQIGASELARSQSPIKNQFVKKYGPNGLGADRIKTLIARLQKCGVYDPQVNPDFAARALMSIIAAPFLLPSTLSADASNLESGGGDDWINYIGDLFDRQLRPNDYELKSRGHPLTKS